MEELDAGGFNKREAVGFFIVREGFAQHRLSDGCCLGLFAYNRILHSIINK
jgi:hypothetical protein